jgi:hypothetical protein
MREFWIAFFAVMAIGAAGALIYSDWMSDSDGVLIERAPADAR